MKEILQLSTSTLERMRLFTKKIEKRSAYFTQFKQIIETDFADIIEEDVNTCCYCNQEFKGKSIGPHYKNSRKCALFKANLKRNKTQALREKEINRCPQEEKKESLKMKEEQAPYRRNNDSPFIEESDFSDLVDPEELDEFFYSQ